MPSPSVVLIAPAADLLDRAAAHVIARHRAALPDLSSVHLLLPSAAAIRPLRQRLQRHAGGALLGPQIGTLAGFATARGAQEPAFSALDCRLLLARELENYMHLFPRQEPLALAEEFFGLFEQLSAQAPELADDERRFLARIEKAYQARLETLSREAQLVHTLWRAFLRQTGGCSPAVAYARSLRQAFDALTADERVYLIGFDEFSSAEADVLQTTLAGGKTELWLQGRREGRDGAALDALCARLHSDPVRAAQPDDPRSTWLDAVLGGGATPLRARSAAAPAGGLPALLAADNAEHEARVADLAIRRWLLEGRRNIAVIAQDRRFARRLRALLERAGVALRDEAGWALSTSAATASLMHWLDCCEQNFAFRPLLDLLKSAFYDPAQTLRAEVQDLEQAIQRSKTLSGFAALSQLGDSARSLLRPLQAPLHLLTPGAGARPAQYWGENLLRSLQALPLWAHWHADPAGRALAAALEDLQGALHRSGIRLSWSEFRRLLEHTLERATFTPETAQQGVRLLTLEQSQGLHCDALIVSGAAAGRFPGAPAPQPLFNHAVRAELGLPHWAAQQPLALARFRRLLQAAPEVLVTWSPESADEPAQACAWVEVLQACGAAGAPELAALAGLAQTEVAAPSPLPQRAAAPRPAAGVLPQRLSAKAHQRLMDCPYQFHAAALLGLRAPDEPDEPYSRADFGEQVHAVLAAFERQQPGCPPPFGEPVNAANAARAEQKLREIAQSVFAPELRTRALAQAWFAEFLTLVPRLTVWLAARSDEWPQVLAEESLRRELVQGLILEGRVDRLEENRSGERCIVDYKTGRVPKRADVETGEAVQATHYALAADACVQVEYLPLQREEKNAVIVAGAELMDARIGVRERLLTVFAAMREGAVLPAHGDEDSCKYCDYRGLCRKGAWTHV